MPRDVFLFTCPRTLSNLLVRLLSAQPGWDHIGYAMHPAYLYGLEHFSQFFGPDNARADNTNTTDNTDPNPTTTPTPARPASDTNGHHADDADARREYVRQMRYCFDRILTAREEAHEKNNALLVKNHICQLWGDPSAIYEDTFDDTFAESLTLDASTPTRPKKKRDQPEAGSAYFSLGTAVTVPSAPTTTSTTSPSPSPTPHTNPSLLADAFLASFTPVFLIRHPVLVVDSWYRVGHLAGHPPRTADQPNCEHSIRVSHVRALFDWCLSSSTSTSSPSPAPIVIDADDVLDHDAVARLAVAVGMDPAHIPRTWSPVSTDGLDDLHRSYIDAFSRSTAVNPDKSSRNINLGELRRSWRDRYGGDVAEYMNAVVDAGMEDYNYLRSHKM